MLVVATVTFVLVHLAPGDPASIIAGPDATPENVARLRRELGLAGPLPAQLVHWSGRLLRGDLGDAIFLRRPVTEAIVERLEPTLLLTSWATLVAVLIGVPAGIVSARYHNSAVDQSLMGLALVGLSVPNFLLGLLMILVFGVWLLWLPVAGYVPLEAGVWSNLRSLVMPSLALGLVQSALIARITRSSMLDVLREQFVLTGRAKGLAENVVVYKHALKNAIIPTLTVIGITFALLIGGAVVIETVFYIPPPVPLLLSPAPPRRSPVSQGVLPLLALTCTARDLPVPLLHPSLVHP